MFWTIPTLMTWTRIVAIPLIVGVFYAPLEPATRNLIATVMFIVFAATDWLDGYLARKLNQTSSFGAFLDPVADKFLVCASLLVLVLSLPLIAGGYAWALAQALPDDGPRAHALARAAGAFRAALMEIAASRLRLGQAITRQRAIDAGCKLAGATVHRVTAELDHGEILAQAAVPVLPDDTAATLCARLDSRGSSARSSTYGSGPRSCPRERNSRT